VTTENPEPRPTPALGRIAGLDYGTVRIGIAVSDSQGKLALAVESYTRSGPEADARRFQRLAREEELVRFVVGLPVHLHGGESQKSREARKFGAWLTELTGLPVDFYDERMTSKEAEEILQSAQLTKKRRKQRIDQLAAQIMLQGYLESKHRGQSDPGALDD